MTCTICGSDRHSDTEHIDDGPDVIERDPDDIKLSGGPRKVTTWQSPMSYTGNESECWGCGGAGTNVIDLATSRYYLCRTCALEAELAVLRVACENLETMICNLRGRKS